MPKILNEVFPGSHSKKGDAATAKIQLTMELKSDVLHKMDLKSFRDNDQSYAFDIFDLAKAGDLVTRASSKSTTMMLSELSEIHNEDGG